MLLKGMDQLRMIDRSYQHPKVLMVEFIFYLYSENFVP